MHWNRWRRASALVLGMGAVLAVGAPVAAHEVYTGRATIVAAYAEWGVFDWERMVGNDTLVAIQEAGDGMFAIGYQALRLTEVMCTNGTATARDDVQGSRGTVSMGDGIASTASVDTRQLRWAKASATVEVYKFTFDTCTGESAHLSVKTVTIALTSTPRGARAARTTASASSNPAPSLRPTRTRRLSARPGAPRRSVRAPARSPRTSA